jgi:hypothetical protein
MKTFKFNGHSNFIPFLCCICTYLILLACLLRWLKKEKNGVQLKNKSYSCKDMTYELLLNLENMESLIGSIKLLVVRIEIQSIKCCVGSMHLKTYTCIQAGIYI